MKISKTKNTEHTTWMIPVSYMSDRKKHDAMLFTAKKMKLTHQSESWYKFNTGETSLMRIKYTKEFACFD